MNTSVIETGSVDPRSNLLAVDSTVTIGTDSHGIVLATCTAGVIGPTHVGRWYKRSVPEFEFRFKTTNHSPGVLVDRDPTNLHRQDKYHIELTWGTTVGLNNLSPTKMTAVFPAGAIRNITLGDVA
jgi:hypothetical protein